MTEDLFKDIDIQVDPNKNYLEDLVGDGKKFKDVEALAKGKYMSDTYIPVLERQLDELRGDYNKLREEYNAGPKLQELLDQITNKQQLADNTPQINDGVDTKVPAYDPKEIESLVSSKILEHENTKKQQDNYNQIRTKLLERFGENYKNVLKEQSENLGLTDEFVNDLARKHPSVFLKTFGLDKAPQGENFQSPPNSSARSDSFSPQTTKRTWSYYQKMKKENPDLYRNPKTQVQMHHDAISLGREFEDGDWNAY